MHIYNSKSTTATRINRKKKTPMAAEHDADLGKVVDSPDDEQSGIVRLNEEQLRTLATILYYQEQEAINSRPFNSEHELVACLHDCNEGYGHALSILDEAEKIKEKHADDEEKGFIASALLDHSWDVLDFSLQCVGTYRLRLKYLKEIRSTAANISKALETSGENLTNLKLLAKDVFRTHKDMLYHHKRFHNDWSCLVSVEKDVIGTDAAFEAFLMESQKRLGLATSPFRELEELAQREVLTEVVTSTEQLGTKWRITSARRLGIVGVGLIVMTGGLVMNDILNSDDKLHAVASNSFNIASGISTGLVGVGTSVSRFGGAAAVIATAGFMAFDIFTSQNKIETAAYDSVGLVSGVVGSVVMAGILASVAVTGALASVVLVGAALLASLLVGESITKIGNYFLDKIFKKKSKAKAEAEATGPAPLAPPLPLATDGHQFFEPYKPAAHALALQIAYRSALVCTMNKA